MQYVNALFEIAEESDRICEYSSYLENIRQIFSKNPKYLLLLSAPTITQAEKSAVLDSAFESYPDIIVSFLKLLCKSNKIGNIFDYIKRFKQLENQKLGILSVKIKTAIPLDNNLKSILIPNLEKKYKRKISPVFITDKGIVGGIILELEGKTVDYGIFGRLNDLKKGFTNEVSF